MPEVHPRREDRGQYVAVPLLQEHHKKCRLRPARGSGTAPKDSRKPLPDAQRQARDEVLLVQDTWHQSEIPPRGVEKIQPHTQAKDPRQLSVCQLAELCQGQSQLRRSYPSTA